MVTNFSRGNLNIFNDLILHLRGQLLVANHFLQIGLNFDDRLFEIILYFLFRTKIIDKILDSLVEVLVDLTVAHFNSCIEQGFGYQQFFNQ